MGRVLSIAVLFSLLLVPSGALAQLPMPANRQYLRGPADPPGADARTTTGNTRFRPAPATAPPPRARLRTVRTCRTRRGTRRCVLRRGGRTLRVCTKPRGRRERCRRPRSARPSAADENPIPTRTLSAFFERQRRQASASAILSEGFREPAPGVVKLWSAAGGQCSGSMIDVGLVLTAAHCINSIEFDSQNRFNAGDIIIPASGSNGQQRMEPYGRFEARYYYAYETYGQGDFGPDWAIIVARPNAAGYYPGQYTGTYTAYAATVYPNAELYSIGYPAYGAFELPRYGGGHAQYFCHDRWDGRRWRGTGNLVNAVYLQWPCGGVKGNSGGPLFALLAGGTWGIVGVVNRGIHNGPRADGGTNQVARYQATGIHLSSSQFDARFIGWYQRVLADVRRQGF